MNLLLATYAKEIFSKAITSAFFWEGNDSPFNQELNLVKMLGEDDISKN